MPALNLIDMCCLPSHNFTSPSLPCQHSLPYADTCAKLLVQLQGQMRTLPFTLAFGLTCDSIPHRCRNTEVSICVDTRP